MKKMSFAALLVSLSLCTPIAWADDVYHLPIKDAIKKDIDGNIELYFGDQSHPEVEDTLAKHFFVHKRTGGKKEETSSGSSLYVPVTGATVPTRECNKAMLATTREIQAHARKMGGNAIINIESYYNNQSFTSNDEFECYSENNWVGVMLRGDIVRLKGAPINQAQAGRSNASEADDVYRLPIKDAIERSHARRNLDGNIELYFGDQPHPEVEETLVKSFPVHKRTSGVSSGASSYVPAGATTNGCNNAMLAAAREIQAQARKRGGNAVINIESFHQNNQSFRSNDEFECYSRKGSIGVMLRGEIVRLKE